MDLSNKVKVLGARVVLKMDEQEEQTKNGIILPDSMAKEPTFTGLVVSAGDGQRLSNGTKFPLDVEIGDRVLYQKLAGVPTQIEGEEGEFLVINERDILAIFPKKED